MKSDQVTKELKERIPAFDVGGTVPSDSTPLRTMTGEDDQMRAQSGPQ